MDLTLATSTDRVSSILYVYNKCGHGYIMVTPSSMLPGAELTVLKPEEMASSLPTILNLPLPSILGCL